MVTSYLYDDQGRVARTVTRSPWTEEDRALMLARQMYLDSLCPGDCGQPREQAHHPDNDGEYDIDEELTCFACKAREEWDAEQKKGGHTTPGLIPRMRHDRDYTAKPLPPDRLGSGKRFTPEELERLV